MVKKRKRTINIIATWMILASLPGIYAYVRRGVDPSLIIVAAFEWVYFACSFIAAIGLYAKKPWARRFAIKLFAVYFCWTVYVAYTIAGGSFHILVEVLSDNFLVPRVVVRSIVITFIITYIMWPIMAILILTYPGIKQVFDPKYDPKKEADFEPAKY